MDACLKSQEKNCDDLEAQAYDIVGGLDPYALDFPAVCVEGSEGKGGVMEKLYFLRKIRAASNKKHILKDYFPKDYEKCEVSFMLSN